MKKKLNSQLANELMGQAILDLVFQSIPVSEDSLVEQLRIMQTRVQEIEQKNVLQRLIDDILIHLKEMSCQQDSALNEAALNMSRKKNKLH